MWHHSLCLASLVVSEQVTRDCLGYCEPRSSSVLLGRGGSVSCSSMWPTLNRQFALHLSLSLCQHGTPVGWRWRPSRVLLPASCHYHNKLHLLQFCKSGLSQAVNLENITLSITHQTEGQIPHGLFTWRFFSKVDFIEKDNRTMVTRDWRKERQGMSSCWSAVLLQMRAAAAAAAFFRLVSGVKSQNSSFSASWPWTECD